MGWTETATDNKTGQAESRRHCSSHSSEASLVGPDQARDQPDHWLPVCWHVQFKMCCIMQSVTYGTCPAHLTNIVKPAGAGRTCSSLHSTSSTTRCRGCAQSSLNVHSRKQDHLYGMDCPKFCRPWLTQFSSENSWKLTILLQPIMFIDIFRCGFYVLRLLQCSYVHVCNRCTRNEHMMMMMMHVLYTFSCSILHKSNGFISGEFGCHSYSGIISGV